MSAEIPSLNTIIPEALDRIKQREELILDEQSAAKCWREAHGDHKDRLGDEMFAIRRKIVELGGYPEFPRVEPDVWETLTRVRADFD